jgi:hypothetical protein
MKRKSTNDSTEATTPQHPMRKGHHDVPASVLDNIGSNKIFESIQVRFLHRPKNRSTDTVIEMQLSGGSPGLVTFRSLPLLQKWLIDHGYCSWSVVEHIDMARKSFAVECRKKNGTFRDAPPPKDQSAKTPPCIYRYLDEGRWRDLIGRRSTFDPCPTNWVKDGLAIDWNAGPDEFIYCNPPYKYAQKWVTKVIEELKKKNCHRVVMLMPLRGNPKWFHDGVLHYATRVVVARGGLRFVGYKNPLPTGVALIFFDNPLTVKDDVPFSSTNFHLWDEA